MAKGLKSIFGRIKSRRIKKNVRSNIFKAFSKQLTPATVAGSKNFNTEQRTLKKLVKSGNIQGAANYVKQQKTKIRNQRSSKK